jgi:hypothetical protein
MLDQLDSQTLAALGEVVGRLKHDLGKYVAFQVRWVAPDAEFSERRDALEADLLSTRRGPDGAVDAPTVWRQIRPVLVGEVALPIGGKVDLSNDVAVQIIEQNIAIISLVVAAFQESAVGEAELSDGTAAALAVSEACRDLYRRVRHRESA